MGNDSRQHRILSWLASVPAAHLAQDSSFVSPRPRKRLRLHLAPSDATTSRHGDAPHALPTPSASSARGDRLMSASQSKRRRDDQDLTPRAVRTVASADDGWSAASSSSHASSSRGSGPGPSRPSPSKQIRHASLQLTGFRQVSFEFDPRPPALDNLCRRLRAVHYGCNMLPARLKPEFASLELPHFFFHDDADDGVGRRYPERTFIRHILRQANGCDLDRKVETSWNMDVHSHLLAWVLQDDSDHDVSLGSEYCAYAGLLREFEPSGAPGKMVDFCLTIHPKRIEDQEAIQAARSRRPGDSINHTDWGSLSRHPIAISVETKRHGEQFDAALLELATWHSAQWRSLQWGKQESLTAPEFLSGLIVQGHDWQFVPSLLGKEGIPGVVRPPLQIGDTRTELGILKLLSSLQELKKDAEQTFWPAFRSHMLADGAVDC